MSHLCQNLAAKWPRLANAQSAYVAALRTPEAGGASHRDDIRRTGAELTAAYHEMQRAVYAHWFPRMPERINLPDTYREDTSRLMNMPSSTVPIRFHALEDGRVFVGDGDGIIHVFFPAPTGSHGGLAIRYCRSTVELGLVRQIQAFGLSSVATLHKGGTIYIQEMTESGRVETVGFLGHGLGERTFQVLPDGRVISGGMDGTISIWAQNPSHADFDLLENWQAHQGRVEHVSMLPDGRIVSAGDDGVMKVWTREGDVYVPQTYVGEVDDIRMMCVTPEGRILCVGTEDIDVWVMDGDRYVLSQTLHMQGWLMELQYIPDEQFMTLSSGTVCFYRLEHGEYRLYKKVFEGAGMTSAQVMSDGTIYGNHPGAKCIAVYRGASEHVGDDVSGL